MSQVRFVKPAVSGILVKDQDGRPIPEAGTFVPYNVFWATRLLHKDVVEAAPPAEMTEEVISQEALAAAQAIPAPLPLPIKIAKTAGSKRDNK